MRIVIRELWLEVNVPDLPEGLPEDEREALLVERADAALARVNLLLPGPALRGFVEARDVRVL